MANILNKNASSSLSPANLRGTDAKKVTEVKSRKMTDNQVVEVSDYTKRYEAYKRYLQSERKSVKKRSTDRIKYVSVTNKEGKVKETAKKEVKFNNQILIKIAKTKKKKLSNKMIELIVPTVDAVLYEDKSEGRSTSLFERRDKHKKSQDRSMEIESTRDSFSKLRETVKKSFVKEKVTSHFLSASSERTGMMEGNISKLNFMRAAKKQNNL